jgi:hypothetical protein
MLVEAACSVLVVLGLLVQALELVSIGLVVTVGRSGYRNDSAPFAHLLAFDPWVAARLDRFDALLQEGERVVGEWVSHAMSTLYVLPDVDHMWRPFDIMRGHDRASAEEVAGRCAAVGLRTPFVVRRTQCDPAEAYAALAATPAEVRGVDGIPEGLVYRMQERGRTLFLGKWVRADYEPGVLMLTGDPPAQEVRA